MHHVTLRKYQREGVRRIQEFEGRALLADDMGLGKTVQALYWAWKYLPEHPPGPIVVVCPASIKFHWEREALKHLGLRVEVLFGQSVPDYGIDARNPNQIYVINYDILTQPRRDGKSRRNGRNWADFLNGLRPRLVIGDECHYVKAAKAARTKAFRRLCRNVPHVLLLSGTPMTNRPTDLWAPLNILHPARFPAYWSFCHEYTHMWKAPWGSWVSKGAKNLPQLHAELNRCGMIRRLKTDVLDDLPPKTRTVVDIEIDAAEYRRAEDDFLGWLESVAPGAARRAARAEQITRMGELKRLAGRLKVPGVAAWVREFAEASGEKLLLGAIHRGVTHPLMDELESETGAVLVDGECNDKEKTAAFDTFNGAADCRLLVGNVQAAGVGWSCRATSYVALCELPWVPGDCVQFEDRVHGIGRGTGAAVNAYYLVAPGTIESDLARVLDEKAGWSAAALDGGAEQTEFAVYDRVADLMKERRT